MVSGLPSMEFDELFLGRLVGEEPAAEHQPVADAMLQRNAPAPAGIVRYRNACTGGAAPVSSVCTAAALSHGSQCDQSS